MKQLLIGSSVTTLIALGLVGGVLLALLDPSTRSDPVIWVVLPIMSLTAVFIVLPIVSTVRNLTRGTHLSMRIVNVPLGGNVTVEMPVPVAASSVAIILMFQRSPDLFVGTISVRRLGGDAPLLGSRELPTFRPHSIVPARLGGDAVYRSRFSGKSFLPVVVPLGETFASGDTLHVAISLDTNPLRAGKARVQGSVDNEIVRVTARGTPAET